MRRNPFQRNPKEEKRKRKGRVDLEEERDREENGWVLLRRMGFQKWVLSKWKREMGERKRMGFTFQNVLWDAKKKKRKS
jgi:hypothetical protein